MKRNTLKNKLVSIFVTAAFILSTFAPFMPIVDAFADSSIPGPAQSLKELNAGTFSLPQNLGYIKEFVDVPNSARTVIHIQDAHCNYAAQQKISEILGYLNTEYGISAVNCEGAAKEYDLSPFTNIPEKDIREKTSDHFVRDGMISAAESFAVNNPEKVSLWGVEDADLYMKNLKVYRESLGYKTEVERSIRSIGYVLDNLKKRIYSTELLEFDDTYNKYKDGRLGFKEYLAYLVTVSRKSMINMKSFPNVYLLSQTLDEEDRIDFKRANNEKDEVVDKLKKVLSRNELEELVTKVAQLKAARISQGEFYAYLNKKAKSIKLNLKDYPELEKYIIYISIYSAVDRTSITKELDTLEDRIKESLCKDDRQRELSVLSKNLALEKNMFDISLTRDDYMYYRANRAGFETANFMKFIDKYAPLYKIRPVSYDSVRPLDRYREKIQVFYECSLERDKAFVKNIKFTDHTRPSSIIITGGFHTENLRELFKDEKVSYISIMPKFTSPAGYVSPYLKRLAGQRTALENVIDTAIPAVLNLQVVEILSRELAEQVEGKVGLERFKLAVAIVAALARGQKFILKVGREAYIGKDKPQEDKVIVFNRGEGGNVSSMTVSSGQAEYPVLAAEAAYRLDRIGGNIFEFSLASTKPPAPVIEAAPVRAPVLAREEPFKPFASVAPDGQVTLLPGATPAQITAVSAGEPMYEAARAMAPDIARAMRRGAPTYLLSPAISQEDIAPETSNNRTAEQILGKQGHEIHAKSYLANGENWDEDLKNMESLLKSTLKNFAPDSQNRLTRMAIRVISDDRGERIAQVRKLIRDILMKDHKFSVADADNTIDKQIKFIPISVQNVKHMNASVDLFADIGMMELNRYIQGDYPREEIPATLSARVIALLRASITNFDDIMKLVKTEEDIEGILNAIFKCSVVLQIRPVDWKAVDEWKKANDAILKSL